MRKKCFLYFLCFMIIASSCAVAFSSFALETVSLPFPSPSTFGADSPIIVYERSDGQYYMIVMYSPVKFYADYVGGDEADYNYYGSNYIWRYNDNKIQIFANTDTSSDIAFNMTPIIYYWNPSNGYYNVQIGANVSNVNAWNDVLSIGSTRSIADVITFNSSVTYTNDSGLRQHNKQYVFSGELNQPDLNTYLLQIDNSLKVAMQSIQNLQNAQNSKFTRFISEYVAMNTKLSSIDSNLQILVDSMTEEHSAPATTENAQISEYNQSENEVAGSHFSALDDFSVPEFGGGLGNIANALNFIGRSLEDLTGNSHDNVSSDSIDKIGTVIFTVLMIGLVSLILNMVHNKE